MNIRRLWSLWRGRHDNPLYWYLHPTRRRWDGIAYRLGWLPLILAITALVIWPWVPELVSEYARELLDIESALVAITVAGLLFPIYFQLISTAPWRRDRCIDLALSRLTPAEVAFGFAWWPSVGLCITALGCVLLALVALLSGDLRESQQVGACMVLTAIPVMALSCLDFLGARGWRRWSGLFFAPAKAFIFFLPNFMLFLPWMTNSGNISSAMVCIIWLAIITPWVLSRFSVVGCGLGHRLLRAAAVEPCARHAWLVRETDGARLPRKGLPQVGHFIRVWSKGMWVDLVIALFGVLLLIFLHTNLSDATSGSDTRRVALIASGIVLAPMMVAAMMLTRRGRIGGASLPILSGGLTESILLYSLLPVLAVLGTLAAILLPEARHNPMEWLLAGALFVGFPVSSASLVAAGLLLVRRGSALLTMLFLFVGGCTIHWLLRSVEDSSGVPPGVAVGLLGAVAISYLEPAFVRLFKAETLDVPLGRLTTDDNSGLPFMSDDLIDRLTADAEGR